MVKTHFYGKFTVFMGPVGKLTVRDIHRYFDTWLRVLELLTLYIQLSLIVTPGQAIQVIWQSYRKD
jgi:hypothetical protein